MTSKISAARRPGARSLQRAAITWLLGFASAALGCSVYDESLKQSHAALPAAGSTDGGAAFAGSDAGGAAGTLTSGGTGNVAGTDGFDAGAPGSGGDAGETSHGNGGVSNGGEANGGSAGTPSGGVGGAVFGGSAGTLANAGNAGTAGATTDLGIGKPTTASTQQPANPSSSGNDGQVSTRWSATTAALPQWWRVDLGASHALSQVSVQFEFPDRKYTFAVETSPDDSAYTTQANVVDGMGAVQLVPIPSQVTARYVRITCTNTVPGVDPSTGASRPTWVSFWEVSIQGS